MNEPLDRIFFDTKVFLYETQAHLGEATFATVLTRLANLRLANLLGVVHLLKISIY